MVSSSRSRRYAQAIFEIALEDKTIEKWQADLERIASLVKDVTIEAVLDNPKVEFKAKADLINLGLGGVAPLAVNLVHLLIGKTSLGIAGEISAEYRKLVDEYHGIRQAEVVTAAPLDTEEQAHVTKYLGDVVGKKVILKTKVDPSLVGGVIARIGDKLLDGSTRTRLDNLKKELAGTK